MSGSRSHRTGLRFGIRLSAIVAGVALFIGFVPTGVAHAAGGSISGVAFQDANRNGVRDTGESVWAGHQVNLFSSAGPFVATTTTGADGLYRFDIVDAGSYRVEYDSSSWGPLAHDWVPTTTGSVSPTVSVSLTSGGSATANFGWRPLAWSTDLSRPLSTYTGTNGLRVDTYNDALTGQQVYGAVIAGGLVGSEASKVTIRFAYGSTNSTTTSVIQSNGQYTSYQAAVTVSYDSWLNGGDATLFHEYGHAWSLYYAHIVQQDPTMRSYLEARGIANDSRVNSNYGWGTRELIAEDYRQLFGTANAQARPQANTALPPARSIPGLEQFLASTFTQAQTSPAPPPPAAAQSVSAVTVNPSTVKSTGTVSYTLSLAGDVAIDVLDSKGTVVRRLVRGTAAAGANAVVWDRTTDEGRRAKAGAYTVRVTATSGSSTASGNVGFTVA